MKYLDLTLSIMHRFDFFKISFEFTSQTFESKGLKAACQGHVRSSPYVIVRRWYKSRFEDDFCSKLSVDE